MLLVKDWPKICPSNKAPGPSSVTLLEHGPGVFKPLHALDAMPRTYLKEVMVFADHFDSANGASF